MLVKLRVIPQPCRHLIGNLDEIACLDAGDCDSLQKLRFLTETEGSYPDLLGAQTANSPALT